MTRPISAALLLLASSAAAQFPLVRSHELRPGQQRPRIHAIAEDARGLIWAASDMGLLRTDGHSTELVARIAGITALTARASTACAATDAGAVLRCDGLRCDTVAMDSAYRGGRVRQILATADGALWIATRNHGLHRLNKGERKSWTIANGLPDNHVNALAAMPDGQMAVATDQGIVVIDGDAIVARMSESEGAPDNLVLSVAADSGGTIWAGSDRGGLFRWKPGQAAVPVAQPWPFGAVPALALTNGMLWAMTELEGLVVVDLELTRGIYRPDEPLPRAPRMLMAASDGALWWCDGTEVLRRADPAVLVAAEHEGLGLRDITALCIDGSDRLWFAKGHRLFHHDARFSEESRVREVPVPVSPVTPIVSLAAGADGTLWAATFGSGVVTVSAEGAVRRLTTADGLSNDNVLHVRAAGDAAVLATLEGISIWRDGAFRRAGAEAGFVFDALADGDEVYLATDGKGVRVLRGGVMERVSANDRTYYTLLKAGDGAVWAAGPGTGFCMLNASGEQCHAATAAPFDGDLYALGETAGHLIAFGSTGTGALDLRTRAVMEVGAAFGLEGATAELGATANDAQGALWLASSHGLHRLEPQPVHFAQHVPVVLMGALLDGQPMPLKGDLQAPHDRSALVLRFTAIHWADPGALRFQYRLLGFSERIIETRDREAAFPELPPGRYTFQVRAMAGSDADAAPWTELAITIHPPWWQRPWFVALAALAGMAVALLLIRARERRIQEREAAEREKVRFQLEALRSQVDPHFLFNSFNALMELIERDPAEAVEHVEQLSAFFRNILQVRDKERIAVEEELRLLQNYFALEQRRFGDAIRLAIDVDEGARRRGVVPLTLQLLVENALKHNVVAGPEPFVVRIACEGDSLVVRNPIRPRATPPRSTGFGLDSIAKRYKALTERPLAVLRTDGDFVVRLPLLDFAA